ncbi:MAG: cobalt-precorrin-5B (C(1))-methyltransferase CbiD [Pseudomonadota bacterium]|nr:cobalt-precorrin-5B (C(1))-methyltransferase CbiD [Pseudomonadota bacterium]
MSSRDSREFDLGVLAPNGLRRGRTTGSCATAAVKAALSLLLRDQICTEVLVSLPANSHYADAQWQGAWRLRVPIQRVAWLDGDAVRAEVRKDGGDDPDSTHGATIFAEVRRNTLAQIRFFAGAGVGTVTRPGIRVPVGEPAINPVPRQMMRDAVAEVAGIDGGGFDLTIGCENGAAIASKTFNPRLGIVGGISILGTSGIVEPMSMASWIASIEVYVRVALAAGTAAVAYLPGKIGRDFAREQLALPTCAVVEIANFLGDALSFTEQALQQDHRQLETLWLAGHPGKLAKVLDDVWDTHSSKSTMAMGALARVAQERAMSPAIVAQIGAANTVEAVIELLRGAQQANAFWCDVEHRIALRAAQRVPSVQRVAVRLFDLGGSPLGQGA